MCILKDTKENPNPLPFNHCDLIQTINEIEKIIMNLKRSRVQGPDGLSGYILKLYAKLWAQILTPVFSSATRCNEIPESWKGGIRIPIYKKGSCTQPKRDRMNALLDMT